MQINYLGHSCFKIKSKNLNILIDPFHDDIGLHFPPTEANMVIVTHDHPDHNNISKVAGNPFVIKNPGEYEIQDVSVFGFKSFHDKEKGSLRGLNTIFTIHTEDLSLCHLGDLGDKLTDAQLEELDGIDVLFVPVGGFYTLDVKEIVEVVNQIEPKIVIPMHYKVPQLNPQLANNLKGVEEFLKEMGVTEPKVESKLILTKASLPLEMTVYLLTKK